MSRVIAALACGFSLAACSMGMPSLDFLKSAPTTEVLRVESEPPGADARTAEGQSCRTPCELTVPSGTETAVSFALNGYQPQTVQVRAELPTGSLGNDQGSVAARLTPNPVYAELQPTKGGGKKKSAPRAKAAKRAAPAPAAAQPAEQPTGSAAYPWPDPR